MDGNGSEGSGIKGDLLDFDIPVLRRRDGPADFRENTVTLRKVPN